MAAAMKWKVLAPALDLILRLGLGGLFVYAGVQKLRDLEQFFWDIHHFDLTPWDISMVLAMFLPWLEIFVGLALVVRRWLRGALLIATGLSLVFLGAIGSAWWRGLDLTCGCFGKEENNTNFPQHLALNGGMLAACLALAWAVSRENEPAAEPIEGSR